MLNTSSFWHSIFSTHFDIGMFGIPNRLTKHFKGIFSIQGRIQDFHLEGAQNNVHARTLQVQNPKSLSAGVKGPGSCRIFYALSCYLSLILRILIQNGI